RPGCSASPDLSGGQWRSGAITAPLGARERVTSMQYVAVVSKTDKPLMPCHPARARELIRKGRAVRRFREGFCYIQLLAREDGQVQPVACGIDPGSKWEGFSVTSS